MHDIDSLVTLVATEKRFHKTVNCDSRCFGVTVNTWSHEQNGHHFADNIFRFFFSFVQIIVCLIQISLKDVPKGPVFNISSLVQGMAWFREVNKPIPEPMIMQFTDPYCTIHLALMSERGENID